MAITGPRVSVNGARVHSRGVARQVPLSLPIAVPDNVALRHLHTVKLNQFPSAYYWEIDAPITTVWAILRRFDSPEEYKPFILFCHLASGNGQFGSIRHLVVHRNLPGKDSIERLDILDDDAYVSGFSIIGGDNNLKNYRSVTTLHTAANGERTVVVESYVVDVPPGGSLEAFRVFVNTVIHFNMIMLTARSYNEAGIVKPLEALCRREPRRPPCNASDSRAHATTGAFPGVPFLSSFSILHGS